MAKPDSWMPIYWADFFADTLHLDRAEIGSYMLLIGAYWRRGKPLPDDDNQLRMICRCDTQQWARCRGTVAGFFEVKDGLWRHGRIDKELTEAQEMYEAKSRSGKAGAEKRWQTHRAANGEPMADPMANAWQIDAQPQPQPQPQYKGQCARIGAPLEDANIPTRPEVETYGQTIGATPESVARFWDYYHGKNLWLNQHNRLINWKHLLKAWAESDRKLPSAIGTLASKTNATTGNVASASVMVIANQKALDRVEAAMKRLRESYSDHQSWSKPDVVEFKTLRTEKKRLMEALHLTV